jgi:predicted metalloprotease
MPRSKGVIRIDSDSTHGWQVRVYRHGKTYSKLFSDRKCGGKEEAYEAALAYRMDLEGEVMAMPEAEPKRRLIQHNKNNATGVLGISRTFKRDRHGHRHEVYAVSWNPEPGKARGTSFSIAKYGQETAFKMACRLRYQRMKEIHGEGFGYSSYLELFEEGRPHLQASAQHAAQEAMLAQQTSGQLQATA